MASLRQLTVDDLRACLVADEIASVGNVVAGGESEINAWLQDKLVAACDRVCGAVAACPRNLAIPYGLCKVPATCAHTALILARHAVISCVPGMSETLEGSSRSAEYHTAVADLRAMASCQLDVGSYADDPDISGPHIGIGIVSTPSFNWAGL